MGHISSGLGSKALKTFALLDQIVTVLGSTTTTLWPFIESTGNIARSYEEAVHTFELIDSGGDGFHPLRHVGGIHSYYFNSTFNMHGAGEDHADYTFGDGSTDSAFSVGAWIFPTAAGENTILAKYDVAGTLREWKFILDSSRTLQLELYDESADATEIGTSGTALTLNEWAFVVVTYDGDEVTPAVNFYVNGAVDNDGDGADTTESGTYTAMEDTATPLMLGGADDIAAVTNEWDGRIALPFVCGQALSSANVTTLHGIGQALLGI